MLSTHVGEMRIVRPGSGKIHKSRGRAQAPSAAPVAPSAGLRPVTEAVVVQSPAAAPTGQWVSIFAPACPMLPTRDRHEIGTDIDVDVAHVGVSHGTALMMVGDQPLDDRALAGTGIEVHGIAACVPRWPPSAGNHGTRPAR